MYTLLVQEQKKFSDKIKTFQSSSQVRKLSTLQRLYPSLNEGVLGVGGRLASDKLNDEAKYQRVVSQRTNLATLLFLILTILLCMLGQIKFWFL